jgi:hypothetical protein
MDFALADAGDGRYCSLILFPVVPAKAGTHAELEAPTGLWVPAFAETTMI